SLVVSGIYLRPVRNSGPLFIGVLSLDSDFVTLNFFTCPVKTSKKPRNSASFTGSQRKITVQERIEKRQKPFGIFRLCRLFRLFLLFRILLSYRKLLTGV